MIEWQKAVLSSSDLKELWLGLSPGWRFYLYRTEEPLWTGEAWELGQSGHGLRLKESGSKEGLARKLEAFLERPGIECDL